MVHLSCSSDAETAFVTPGDTISVSTLHVDGKKQPELHVGPGLRVITSAKKSEANDVTVQVVVAGDLRRKGNTVWVDGIHKRALPSEGDYVIGIIVGTPGENYNVDIGGSCHASLHNLAFEGATKRNRPRLKVGDIVYARIQLMHKYMEPELTCVHKSGNAQGLGPLEGGFLFECSLALSRQLLSRSCVVLQALGAALPFEITIGRNGRIWVKASQPNETLTIIQAIKASEHLSPKHTRELVKQLINKLQRQ
eukprot:gene5911-7304_t